MSLRFNDGGLEKKYDEEQALIANRTLQETTAVGLVIVLLVVLGAIVGLAQPLSAPMVLQTLFCGLILACFKAAAHFGRKLRPWLPVAFAALIACLIAIVPPLVLAPTRIFAMRATLVGYGYLGLVMFAFASFLLLRLRFLIALLLNLLALLAYTAMLGQIEWFPLVDRAFHFASILFGIMVGFVGGWSFERLLRANFAQRELLVWREHEIARERERSEALLRNILPAPVAARLKAGESSIADGPNEATVIFADIVGFTPLTALLSAHETVALLDELFTGFDALAARMGVEKIKTIGDAYMVVAGLPIHRDDHTELAARLALDMRQYVRAFQPVRGQRLQVRIGLDTGPVVAGVIGRQKFAYDLWGDAVNTASRMESHGEPDRIHVTEEVAARLNGRFQFVSRGEIAIKGKGPMRTFWLEGASA